MEKIEEPQPLHCQCAFPAYTYLSNIIKMSDSLYKQLLNDGDEMQFIFGGFTMDVRYHDHMLFTVVGDATFPKRDEPMSYWHLRSFFVKHAKTIVDITRFHPLELIKMEVDETEPTSLAKWLHDIGVKHYPKSVEPVDEEARAAWKALRLQRKQEALLEKQYRREQRIALRELIRKERAELKAKDELRTPASRKEARWLASPLYETKGEPVILKVSFDHRWDWDDDVEGETVILKRNYLFDWNGQTNLRLYQLMYRIARSKGMKLNTAWEHVLWSIWRTEGRDKGRSLYAIEVGAH
jgi:hypothetical protein